MSERVLLPHFARSTVAAGLLLASTACGGAPNAVSADDPGSPLRLARAIELPGVAGRIDHLAIDPAHQRLYVAEVANGSVDVIDLAAGKSIARVGGLHEPQGVAWLASTGEWAVACGDGSVHVYSGGDNHETAQLDLGSDADDVRIDARNGHLVVGYGEGGLAEIDPGSHAVLSRTTFKGHPEGFQLSGGKAWVNDPDDGSVLALDLDAGKVLARWPTGGHRLNFPMALSPHAGTIAIAYRFPAALARINTVSGKTLAIGDACGDSDDLYLVGDLALVVCGAGHVDVVKDGKPEARGAARGGGRTGLYVPETNRLFVALPARDGKPAAIWEQRLGAAESARGGAPMSSSPSISRRFSFSSAICAPRRSNASSSAVPKAAITPPPRGRGEFLLLLTAQAVRPIPTKNTPSAISHCTGVPPALHMGRDGSAAISGAISSRSGPPRRALSRLHRWPAGPAARSVCAPRGSCRR